MRRSLVTGLLCSVFTIGYCLPVHAWMGNYGIGARAIGMGGTFTAVADDYTAAFYNPAGLGQITRSQVGLEFIFVKPDITVKNLVAGGDLLVMTPDKKVRMDPTDGVTGDGLDYYAAVIGLAINVNQVMEKYIELPVNTTFGVLMEVPQNLFIIRYFPPDMPHFISYGDLTNHLSSNISLGVEAIEKLLYVGGGISLGMASDGAVNALNTQLAQDYKWMPFDIGMRVEGNFAPCFGILLTPLDQKLKLGYSYRRNNQIDVDPLAIVASINTPDPIDMPFVSQIYTNYTPDTHTLGISYQFDSLLLACDVVFKKWSDFDYNDTEKAVYSEANRTRYGMVGIIPDGPEFDDTIDIHVGGEYRWDDHIKLTAGFEYRKSPVPDQSGKITNYIDMDQNIYSAGAGYKFRGFPLELTGALRYFTFDDLTVDKTGVKGVTWGEAVDSTIRPSYLYTQNSYKVSGQAYMATIGAKITF